MAVKIIRVCCGRKCTEHGAESIMERLSTFFGLQPGGKNDQTDLDFCACTGYCEQAANVVIDETHIIHEAKAETIAEKIERGETSEIYIPDFDTIAKDDFLGDL